MNKENNEFFDPKILYLIEELKKLDHSHQEVLTNNAPIWKSKDYEILFGLSIQYARNSEFRNALFILHELSCIQKNDVRIFYNLGLIYSITGNQGLALESYDKAHYLNPFDPDVLTNKGATLNDLQRYGEALSCLNLSLTINANIPETWSNLGIAQKNLSLHTEAIKSYENALNLRPNYAEAFYNKAVTLNELKRYDEAIAHYDQALALKPDYAEAWSNKGGVLGDLKRHNEAIAHYDRAIAIKPEEIGALYGRALAYHYLGNIDNAINDLNLVIKHNGKDLIAAEFLLSALKGDAKPTQMPIEYAANLFDDYSDEFESHLIGNLKYQGPQTLYLAVQEFLSKNMVALDIGCGTGLMGKFLKAHTSNLIGIDISQKMLDLAKLKHIYDELILSDANSFLENCKVEFDLVVAVDVFIYIGDLSFTFSRLKNLIRKSGLFCFTVEKMNLGNWSLSPNTLRYSHSRGYVESLSTEHGFKVKVISTNLIRQERGNNVEGYYFVLEKN